MQKGSFTVEAVLCMPVFVFSILLCIYINRIVTCQDDVFWALNSLSKEVSLEASTTKKKILENPAAYALRMEQYIPRSFPKISFLKSSYDKNSDEIELVASYRIKLPFSLLFIRSVPVIQKVKTRAFVGVESRGSGKAEDEQVYITETGKVYHRNLECTYLKLSISQVLFSDIANLRNESGGKYKACKTCAGGNIAPTKQVYITNYGDSYHLIRNCSGIKRTIKTIALSQVGKRLPCAKCGE